MPPSPVMTVPLLLVPAPLLVPLLVPLVVPLLEAWLPLLVPLLVPTPLLVVPLEVAEPPLDAELLDAPLLVPLALPPSSVVPMDPEFELPQCTESIAAATPAAMA